MTRTETTSADRSRSARRAGSHARWETGLLLRNGEQLLLTLVIPFGLLLALTFTSLVPGATSADHVARALATVLAVSVLSSAFASLAIATGFERRSGALRFLGTTPLSRSELLAGKMAATGGVTFISSTLVVIGAVALDWRPEPGAAWAVPIVLLGIATCASWGMALAGLLRAEAVLAVANGIFLVLLMFGGVIIPAASLPGPLATIAPLLPSGALVEAFTCTLVNGTAPSVGSIAVLIAWLAGGTALSGRTFRWS